jgi:hypothetical protein
MRLTVGATVAVRELVTADGDRVAVPDPGKALYREFGVEASRRALLDPRAYATIARSIAHTLWEVPRHRRPAPPKSPYGGRWGLPADFLIAGDGRVVDVKYGAHAADHWPVGEVLRLARQAAPPVTPAAAAGPAQTGNGTG